jgi:hypothetical protein
MRIYCGENSEGVSREEDTLLRSLKYVVIENSDKLSQAGSQRWKESSYCTTRALRWIRDINKDDH